MITTKDQKVNGKIISQPDLKSNLKSIEQSSPLSKHVTANVHNILYPVGSESYTTYAITVFGRPCRQSYKLICITTTYCVKRLNRNAKPKKSRAHFCVSLNLQQTRNPQFATKLYSQ